MILTFIFLLTLVVHGYGNPASSSEIENSKEQCGQVQSLDDRILGGEDAVQDEWPWIAALGFESPRKPGLRWICAGALVTRRHVLTVAHCVDNPSDLKLSKVRLGTLILEDEAKDGTSPVDIEIEKAITYPGFSGKLNVNDIAILKLKTAAPLTENIRSICLPSTPSFQSGLEGEVVKVAGWGRAEFGGPRTNKLRQVELKITNEESCRNKYKSVGGSVANRAVIDNRVICTESPGKGTCQGDSGAPLVLVRNSTYHLVGLSSYGIRCGEEYPDVATRVSSFLEWINNNLN